MVGVDTLGSRKSVMFTRKHATGDKGCSTGSRFSKAGFG